MPVPYSNDLRQKAMNLIVKKKKSQVEVAEFLSIDKSTIFRWYKSYRKEGSCDFKGFTDNKHRIKINITDLHKIELLLKTNPFITAKEIALKLSVKVSNNTISRNIKKLGYSLKKTPNCIENEVRKKEGYFRH